MMEQIKAYRTSDGTMFVELEAAERHEEALKHSDAIERFLDDDLNSYRGSQRVIARNSIINWELWKAKNAK